MKPENIWESIFKYDTYSKGGEYSASDIIGQPLMTKLKKENPNHKSDIKYEDRISAFVGTSIHERNEQWLEAENAFSDTGFESEVKLKFRNISGTADIRIDGKIILDYKTGKEKNIIKSLNELKNKKESSWQKQISIYTYLNHKQNKAEYGTIGYIAWLCVDTNKHGVTEVELLPKAEVVKLIKDFLANMEKPSTELDECDGCKFWRYRWCDVRSVCPKFKADDDWSDKVECW